MTGRDPKVVAQERFADAKVASNDLIGQRATDVPLVVRGLVEAVRERAGAGGRVIELGFGSGWLLEPLAAGLPGARLFGLDLSGTFARRARELHRDRVCVLIGDMERLPFRDGAFNVIVTCWTLYFMRDIDGAFEEFRRCLAPGGRLIAATSAPDHELEVTQLVAEAAAWALGRELSVADLDVGSRFDLDTGVAYAQRHFAKVELRTWQGQMMLSTDEIASMWKKWEPALFPQSEQEAMREVFVRLLEERLGADGSLRIRRREGAFVCDL